MLSTLISPLLVRDSTAQEMSHFRYYYYHPSMAAAVIFALLFGAATSVHIVQMFRPKTWFMIPFVVGGVLETMGYIGRIVSASENPGPYSNGPFVMQSLLLLVAPLLLAASIYMELGRIVRMVDGEKKLFIRVNWLTKIFVCGDVVCFLIQGGGAGLMTSSNPNTANSAKYMVIGGLFLQIIFFGLFVISAAIFHIRLARSATSLSLDRPWLKHMRALYVVSGLILLRSVVRCVEFIQGYSGYVAGHEAFLYLFDALPMLGAVVEMSIVHPAEVTVYLRKMREDEGREHHRMMEQPEAV